MGFERGVPDEGPIVKAEPRHAVTEPLRRIRRDGKNQLPYVPEPLLRGGWQRREVRLDALVM
jgi:hypothetical protein